MDSRQFQAMQAQVRQLLVDLTGKAFARATGIAHRAVNVAAGVRVVDEVIHVQTVNSYHGRFKDWLRRFNGVASRYLPNYLGWGHALDGRRVPTPHDFLRAALFLIVI